MEDYNEPFDILPADGQHPANIFPRVGFTNEVSVEPQSAVGVIEEALTLVSDNLTEFAASSSFEADMQTAFGESADVELGKTIIDALRLGEELPEITVLPVEQMNGAAGGFDSLTGEVYLADGLIDESPLAVADVLTEELGHYIDSRLNKKDSPGDEGALFAASVRGDVLSWEDVGRLKREDDKVRIFGGLVEVEADDDDRLPGNDLGKLVPGEVLTVVDDVGFAWGPRRDLKDYYRFELKEESEVALFLSQLRDNADLRLYDDGTVVIFESRNSGIKNETIETILDAGVYYLEVFSPGSARTQYLLDLFASEVEIDPNSTPELARNIGKLTQEKPVQFTDSIGFTSGRFSRDSQDWYRFKLEEDGFFNATLDRLTDNADLRLYDSDGRTVLIESRELGKKIEEIEAFLDAGNYYLEVSPKGAARGLYKLTASVQTQDTTTPEISISNTKITEGNRGRKNAKFAVTLDEPAPETVKVSYATANQTAIANQDYKPTIGTLTFKPGQTRKTITVPILGDTRDEKNETFQVNLSKPKNATLGDKRGIGTIKDNDKASSGGGDRDPKPKKQTGDTFETAINLGKVTEEIVKSDRIGYAKGLFDRDTDDFYRFRVPRESGLVLTLDDLRKNADLQLYGSKEELINQSKNNDRSFEEIETILDPGIYYVRVYSQGSDRTPYRLSIDLI